MIRKIKRINQSSWGNKELVEIEEAFNNFEINFIRELELKIFRDGCNENKST